jgi:hypothetical protein
MVQGSDSTLTTHRAAPVVARCVWLALLLAGCAAPVYEPAPPPAPVPPRTTIPAPPVTPAPQPPGVPATPTPPPEVAQPQAPSAPPLSSGATASLLQQGRQQAAAGDFAMATASLERALRINPRDAALWLELGRVKLAQGDRAQAESMGRRALSLAGSDPGRRAEAEALIAAAQR